MLLRGGWNGSVPWHPRSTTWMVAVAAVAPVVAIVAQLAGTARAKVAKSPDRAQRV